jgi:hypothetical protein
VSCIQKYTRVYKHTGVKTTTLNHIASQDRLGEETDYVWAFENVSHSKPRVSSWDQPLAR